MQTWGEVSQIWRLQVLFIWLGQLSWVYQVFQVVVRNYVGELMVSFDWIVVLIENWISEGCSLIFIIQKILNTEINHLEPACPVIIVACATHSLHGGGSSVGSLFRFMLENQIHAWSCDVKHILWKGRYFFSAGINNVIFVNRVFCNQLSLFSHFVMNSNPKS